MLDNLFMQDGDAKKQCPVIILGAQNTSKVLSTWFFPSIRFQLLRWALGTGIPHWIQKAPRRKLCR